MTGNNLNMNSTNLNMGGNNQNQPLPGGLSIGSSINHPAIGNRDMRDNGDDSQQQGSPSLPSTAQQDSPLIFSPTSPLQTAPTETHAVPLGQGEEGEEEEEPAADAVVEMEREMALVMA